jgi:hypothetical protein
MTAAMRAASARRLAATTDSKPSPLQGEGASVATEAGEGQERGCMPLSRPLRGIPLPLKGRG